MLNVWAFAGERPGAAQNRAAATSPIVTWKQGTPVIPLPLWVGNPDAIWGRFRRDARNT
jgi:hypothetical protein